jgi:hypothetical protein
MPWLEAIFAFAETLLHGLACSFLLFVIFDMGTTEDFLEGCQRRRGSVWRRRDVYFDEPTVYDDPNIEVNP